jgi:hypothetical protein
VRKQRGRSDRKGCESRGLKFSVPPICMYSDGYHIKSGAACPAVGTTWEANHAEA